MHQAHLPRLAKLLATLLVLTLSLASVKAQQHTIVLLANGQKDSIVLRWAPTDPALWQLGNQHGYLLERFTLSRNGKLLSQPQPERVVLGGGAIKPLAESDWQPIIRQTDYAEAVQGLIYEASEASADGSWLSVMERRKEQEQRFGFALFICDMYPAVAQAAALRWVDTDVKPNEEYAYRIRPAFVPEGMEVEPSTVVVKASDSFKCPPITYLQARFLDRKVNLSWSVMGHKGFYTGYHVERSTDSITFAPLTPLPVSPMSESSNDPTDAYFSDSIPANGVRYYYRVRGVTPFATMSDPSPVIAGAGQRLFEARPTIDTAYVLPNGHTYLRWQVESAYLPAVKELAVFVADSHDGAYSRVNSAPLAATATNLTDTQTAYPNSYYRVHAYGFAGDEMAMSFPYFVQRVDSIPPAPPTGLKGVAYKNGLVSVEWNANTEQDVFGYRIFRGNSEGEEFTEVSAAPLAEARFRDSINLHTLTSYIYYKVVALDKRYNTSDYSETLKLRRPDTIAPVAPVIVRSWTENTSVHLQLAYGASSDLARYEAYRILIDSGERELLQGWLVSEHTDGLLTDSLVPQAVRLRYVVVAVDSSENRSEVLSRDFMVETGVRSPITDLKTVVDREAKSISLTWSYPLAREVDRYHIYRAKEGEPLILYKTVEGNKQSFTDTDLSPNNTYTYKLKAQLKNGASSGMSKGWEVKY